MAAVPSIGPAARVEHPLAAASDAAQALYERHYRRILGFCQYQLGTRHEAEDAAQTTFMHALGALQRGVVPAREVPWLLTIARNVCRTRWDAGRRRGRIEFDGDPHVIEETAACDGEPEWTLLGLEDALASLPEQQRLAILLREWQGLSYQEIAEVLGVSVSAVETSIFRARRGLAKKLGDENGRRHGLDLGSLLAGLKSALFGGGSVALKVAATAAVVVAGTGAAVTTVTLHGGPSHAAVADAVPVSDGAVPLPRALRPVAGAPAARQARRPAAIGAPAKVSVVQTPRAGRRPGPPKTSAPSASTPAATPVAHAGPAPTAPAPAATQPPSTPTAPAAHAKPTAPAPTGTKLTDVAKQAVDDVTKPVVQVTTPVVDTVTKVAKPVTDTVSPVTQPVVNVVDDTTQPVVTAVTTTAAPILQPPPAPAPPPATGVVPPLPPLPPLPVTPPPLPPLP
jgi:RNA polymerase sigma factor (sigma-70 family)